jgi:hypothetical protein
LIAPPASDYTDTLTIMAASAFWSFSWNPSEAKFVNQPFFLEFREGGLDKHLTTLDLC